MYNSGDGNPIPGNPLPSLVGPNAQQIAQEQLTAIKNDLNNNKLKDGQVYRVLLVGYSWGADKAMDVAVELRNLIDNDAELSADVKSRIQIHLRTIDAVEKSAGALSLAMMPVLPGDRTAAVGNAVSSWYNFYQDSSFVNIKARPHGAPLGAAANDFGVPGGRADHLTIFQFISANFFASLGL